MVCGCLLHDRQQVAGCINNVGRNALIKCRLKCGLCGAATPYKDAVSNAAGLGPESIGLGFIAKEVGVV